MCDYLVPDRVVVGYGLTGAIAERVAAQGANLLVTVDNGIASVEGVASAQALGAAGADHRPPPARRRAARGRSHGQPQPARLPLCQQGHGRRGGDVLRAAGPARRAARSAAPSIPQPAPAGAAAALVALGTVADVVRLDANNRRLVAQGLKRIRAAHAAGGHGGAVSGGRATL